MATVGERLKEERLLRGWSQRDLAREAGTTAETISSIETGQHEPRPSTLRKLAEGLDLEVRDFYAEPALPKGEAPREAGQPEQEPEVRAIARDAMRRQFERDRKAANRALASEGIRQPARFQDDFNAALQGPLKFRPHDEVVAGLLEAEEDILRLEHMLAQRDAEIARLREEAATLRERERIQ